MKRRDFIKGVSASGATIAYTESAGAEGEQTQILRLFHQIEEIGAQALKYESSLTGEDVDAEIERIFYSRCYKLEEKMMALPCTCAADFAAKMIIDTCHGNLLSNWEAGAIWQEARSLTKCKI